MRFLLLSLALAVSRGYAACSCTMDGIAGTYTTQCLDDMDVVTCNSGKINASLSATPGDTAVFDKATCVHGIWFGTNCADAGSGYFISAATPFFNCPDVVAPTTTPLITTTTPTVPTVPTTTPKAPVIPPCACAYTDAGAELNLAAPVSFCADKVQMLQCDGKISATTGIDFAEYDSVSCTNGMWSGTGCDGLPQAFNAASVTVKCATKEPPRCPQIPASTEGLKYIGTENGMQRYTCEGDELAKHIVLGDITLHAKYIECNATSYRVTSDDELAGTAVDTSVVEFDKITCRDYGKLAPACSIPTYKNAWLHDGKLECLKGTYLNLVSFKIPSQPTATFGVNANQQTLSSAICSENGWSITGTSQSGVKVYYFECAETPTSAGTCGALYIERRSVQHTPIGNNYYCWDALLTEGALRLEAVTPTGQVYSGFRFQCVPNTPDPGEWKLTGIDPVSGGFSVTIPPGSKLSCKPFATTVFPPFPTSLPLVPVGVGASGLTRWACIDSALKIDLEFQTERGGRQPVHSAYIEANNTYFRFISSLGEMPSTFPEKIISSISCEDMGSKNRACTDIVENGGIRSGNRYDCLKGFYLNYVYWLDAAGARQSYDASATDSKSLQCKRDGWAVEGTALSALNVINLYCYEAHPAFQPDGCFVDANGYAQIDAEYHMLQYDAFRKYFTCYAGESLAYTLGGVRTYGAGKKLFCGTNAATNAREWQWSLMDGTEKAVIPLGAKMNCF